MPAKKKSAAWTSKQLATAVARLADEKQAEKIVILDVAQAIQVADYFVVAQGQNGRHLKAIAENVASSLKKDGFHRMGGSSLGDESWVLLDFGPVVLHVLSPKARAYYDLENLWGDCRRVAWRRARPKAAPAGDASAPAEHPGSDGFAPD